MNEIRNLMNDIVAFSEERDWDQFHSPENLAKSIVIEAGELLECYQWSSNANMQDVEEELADILNYCLQLAAKLEADPAGIDDMAKGVWQSYGEAYAEKDVLVKAYLRHVSAGENEEDIFLKAWAQPERKSKWSKGKIVCGWLHRKGEDCVWRGWRAEDD